LKPNGIIVFATCSMQAEEGAPRIENFLKNSPHFSLISDLMFDKLRGSLSIDQVHSGSGFIRTLPFFLDSLGGMDGFYIAALRKSSN